MYVYMNLKVNFQKYIVLEIIFLLYKWFSFFILIQLYKELIYLVNVNYLVKRFGILYKLKVIDMIWIKRDRYIIMIYILLIYIVYFE